MLAMDFIRKSFGLIIILFLFGTQLYAQNKISGFVFVDDNGNGSKERREQGVEGVGVTNGMDVVLTDRQGYYELTVGDDQIISVIKPNGYAVKMDANFISRNYYIHKPNGSQTKEYEGVKPTGPLPKTLNFPLYPQDESKDFRFIVFGDPQMSHPEDIYYFKEGIVSELIGVENVAFGITLGDIVGNRLEGIPPYIEAVGEIGVPWYNVMGNHDINFDVDEDHLSDETFERLLGPPNFAYNYGGTQFIVLDNVLYPTPKGTQNYVSGLREDQWVFLENILKHTDRSKLLVMACHIPLWSFKQSDKDRLYKLLDGFDQLLFLS
ncbi:MAG TPA: metallophosphoesterase N-terminal domain-containing protein, partial [Sphingobacteriaceae bacterium]|nr:metallophosphoesterase N-terminal domain-containing protein [Sphingobacteriaceae bacterium]